MPLRSDQDQELGLNSDKSGWEKEFPAITPFEQVLEESYQGRVELDTGYRDWVTEEPEYSLSIEGSQLDPMDYNHTDQKKIYSLPSA